MNDHHFLRGVATVNFWADDLIAARDRYAALLGTEAYFQMPSAEHPAYVEFRIGDDEDEFGIIDRKYAPAAMQPGPGGTVLLCHVDDVEASLSRLMASGAALYDPLTRRGETGSVTAPVVDPFGNVLGIMTNPHFKAAHCSTQVH